MGAADVVPGVSGGTIAFITGIYDKLLASISGFNLGLLKTLKNNGITSAWKQINGNFLLALVAGITTSILSLAKLITYLMHHYPIQLWSFFFGLILASIIYVTKEVSRWKTTEFVMLLLGAFFILWISTTPPLSADNSYLYLFICGAIAACAMILPGISGSFILLILGAYTTVIAGIANKDFILLACVGLGAISGLLAFSNLLKYLLDKHHNSFVSLLVGFLIGSLWKIWPWKQDEKIFVKGEGILDAEIALKPFNSLTAYFSQHQSPNVHYMTYIEKNISPFLYEKINSNVSHGLLSSIIFVIFGFSVLFIIEFIAKRKNGQ